MAKNPYHKNGTSSDHKKGSYSHDPSPLHSSKPTKDTSSCFHPTELDAQFKLAPKIPLNKNNPKIVAKNVFIGHLNIQMSSLQATQKKTPTPLTASVTNRKNSKQYSAINQREEVASSAYRDSKNRYKNRTPQSSFDATINPHVINGTSYELKKNPLAVVPNHLYSNVTKEVPRNNYIPKFKGSDPNNKFSLRSPPKVFSQIENAVKGKKPTHKNQKSFDLNAGGPLNKFTPYLNSYIKPPVTANSSPINGEAGAKKPQEVMGRLVPQNIDPRAKKPINITSLQGATKSPFILSNHRKTPSFDLSKRSENQKTMTPPVLDRKRKSADCGDYWQRNTESFNKNKSYQFGIRTRAGVAPNGTRKINQDSFVFHTNYGKKNDRHLIGVCDGHGMNGHFVSSFVKDTLPIYLLEDPNFATNIHLAFENAFEFCHQKLSICDFDCRFSGTTVALVLIDGNKIITANAGDSRAIMGLYDKNWNCVNLTFDHKPSTPQEAQRIVKCGGRIEPFKDVDGTFVGPDRVWLLNQDIPGLAMSRSIGDYVAASVGVSCMPEIKEFEISPNDKFLIVASDGVWEFIESIDVAKIIAPFYEQNNIEGACDYLLGLALKSWQEEEEVVVDDITLIIVFF